MKHVVTPTWLIDLGRALESVDRAVRELPVHLPSEEGESGPPSLRITIGRVSRIRRELRRALRAAEMLEHSLEMADYEVQE